MLNCCVAWAGLKVQTFLPQLSEGWNYKYVSPHLGRFTHLFLFYCLCFCYTIKNNINKMNDKKIFFTKFSVLGFRFRPLIQFGVFRLFKTKVQFHSFHLDKTFKFHSLKSLLFLHSILLVPHYIRCSVFRRNFLILLSNSIHCFDIKSGFLGTVK